MDKNFQYKGDWFLPDQPDTRFKGILSYDSAEGTTLELFGVFPLEFIDLPIILGVTTESKEVTLYKNFLHHRGGATLAVGKEVGQPMSLYTTNYILEGHHFKKEEDIRFDELKAEVFNLDEWVGYSGFKLPNDMMAKNNGMRWEYELPEQIDFSISDSLSGQFNFVANRPSRHVYMKEVSIRQRVQLRLCSKEPMTFLIALDNYFTFQNFLTLSLHQGTYPTSIWLYSNAIMDAFYDQPKRVQITLHFAIRKQSTIKIKDWPDMLFAYRLIQNDFTAIISKWYENRYELEPVYNLLFEQYYTTSAFNENAFLNMAQAAESFHARLTNHTRMLAADYDEMKKEILAAVNPKYHKWLEGQFAFGNSLTLHMRLDEMVDKYGNEVVNKAIGDKDEFIKAVKNSRNYYTHYSKSGKKKALQSVELYHLAQKVKALLVSALLEETGFSHGDVEKIMNEHRNYFIPFVLTKTTK